MSRQGGPLNKGAPMITEQQIRERAFAKVRESRDGAALAGYWASA